MSSSKKLIKDTLLYGIANFGSKIIGYLMLPLYTYYFSPSEFGIWDLIVTITTLITPIISFELVSSTYRWLIEEKEVKKQKEIITTGLFTLLQSLLFFNLLFIIILFWFSIPYGWLTILLVNTSIIYSFLQQTTRGLGLNKLFASIGIIQSILFVINMMLCIFLLKLGVEAFLYSTIIANLLTTLYTSSRSKFIRYISPEFFTKDLTSSLLRYSIPIIPGAISWWVISLSDRFFILYFLNIESNGLYALANKIPAILITANSIFSLAWKDSAILSYKQSGRNAYYTRVFNFYSWIMSALVISLIILTRPIFTHIFDPNYYEAWNYVGILLLAALFNSYSLFWSAGLHAAKKTKLIFISSLAAAIVNLIINFVLIHKMKLYAVSLSTAIASFFMWVIRVIYSRKYFNVKINYSSLILILLVLITISTSFLYAKMLNVFISLSIILFLLVNIRTLKYMLLQFFK